MGSYYWIKVYHEVLHDPKMGRLSDHLWRRFFELCLIAGEEDKEGWLPEVGNMAWTLRTTAGDLETDLHLLMEHQLVSLDPDGAWFVTKFADRQSPLSAAERKAKQRERDRQRDYESHGPVTQGVTIRDTEIDIDTESDQNREDAESDPVADALESIGMGQIEKVKAEAYDACLSPGQIIETCKWAKEHGKDAALVRSMLRQGEAHQPRAPSEKWYKRPEWQGVVES